MKAIDYLDRGKTRLDVADEIAGDIGKLLRSVTKNVYKKEKGRKKTTFIWPTREVGTTLKDAVFDNLPQAIKDSTGGGVYAVSARDLYYAVRPLVAKEVEDKALEYNYFSQNLITQYEEEYGPIQGLYRDPRGVLFEPHTGKEIPLGTRDVAKYEFPKWTYNKILYIEKKGVAQQLKPAKLAERFDMAIIAAEGYATEAARNLLELADASQECTFYVLHDADPYGYNIAITLQEETRRMPDYSLDVVDIGLKLQEGHEMGLPMESFTRKNQIPYRVRESLTEFEREYFIGKQISPFSKSIQAYRIEINAIPVPERAAYIEKKLLEFEAPGKIIPPDEELPELGNESYESRINDKVDYLIESILSSDDIKEIIREAFKDKIHFDGMRGWIEAGFKEDDSQWWKTILKNKIDGILLEHGEDIEQKVKSEIIERLESDEQD